MNKIIVQTTDHRMALLDIDHATAITEWGAGTTRFVFGPNNVVLVQGSFEQIANQITEGRTNEQIKAIKEHRTKTGTDPNPIGTTSGTNRP